MGLGSAAAASQFDQNAALSAEEDEVETPKAKSRVQPKVSDIHFLDAHIFIIFRLFFLSETSDPTST